MKKIDLKKNNTAHEQGSFGAVFFFLFTCRCIIKILLAKTNFSQQCVKTPV